MSKTDCPRCGASMETGGVCPVCEIPYLAKDGRAPTSIEPPAATAVGRLWQNGRLGVAFATVCFSLATVLTLVTVRLRGLSSPRRALTAWEIIGGTQVDGHWVRSTILVVLPGAAAGLASFLITRRTHTAMVAARPLVLVASAIPFAAVVLLALRLGRRGYFDYAFGPAAGLVALGALAGAVSALRFGRGVTDAERPSRGDREED